MQWYNHVLHLLVLAVLGATAVFFAPFTAEDAFITYRYAANLATRGALIFNEGEPILAVTSPLHALVAALLFRVTGNPVIANKVLAVILLAAIAVSLYRRYDGQPRIQLLVIALVLLPPCVVMWTFGGLETPVLLFIATSLVLLAGRAERPGLGRLSAVLVLAGLAFLTRYDSALFTLPIVLYALWQSGSLRNAVIACVAGAALPLAWLAASGAYYGDILPTSFYAKTPSRSIPVLVGNGRYIVAFLGFTGIVPAAALVLGLLGRSRRGLDLWLGHAKRYGWLYCAIAAQLAYGLTMATTHMMFSFRFFVPYIPACAILLGDLARAALDARGPTRPLRSQNLVIASVVLGLVLFQAAQAVYTYKLSVNGLGRLAHRVEYASLGLAEYITFIRTLQRQGEDIRRHWAARHDEPARTPRIFTYAGGVVPYTFLESYVYETLVSYRHCADAEELVRASNLWIRTVVDLRLSADYIHLLAPRHGELEQQLPLPPEDYALISSYEMVFDGQLERFLVFHNPAPDPHRLANRIDGTCVSDAINRVRPRNADRPF